MTEVLQFIINFFSLSWVKGLFFTAFVIEIFLLVYTNHNEMQNAFKRILTIMFSSAIFLAAGTITVKVCTAVGLYDDSLKFKTVAIAKTSTVQNKNKTAYYNSSNNNSNNSEEIQTVNSNTNNTTNSSQENTYISQTNSEQQPTQKEMIQTIQNNLSKMSQQEQESYFKKYASASLHDNWYASYIGGAPVGAVQLNNCPGTYYSNVGGYDYLIADNGETYYKLNENFMYDNEGNIIQSNWKDKIEGHMFDNVWYKL